MLQAIRYRNIVLPEHVKKNGKKSAVRQLDATPGSKKFLSFFLQDSTLGHSIIQSSWGSNKFVYLVMSYTLELYNRIRVGFALGWSYYSRDKDHNWNELILYIGLIAIKIKSYETYGQKQYNE